MGMFSIKDNISDFEWVILTKDHEKINSTTATVNEFGTRMQIVCEFRSQ